jgi:hypothetical protein
MKVRQANGIISCMTARQQQQCINQPINASNTKKEEITSQVKLPVRKCSPTNTSPRIQTKLRHYNRHSCHRLQRQFSSLASWQPARLQKENAA